MIRWHESPRWTDVLELPGVSRFDLECHPGVRQDAVMVTRRWAEDRALSAEARERLVRLARTAVDHGLRFQPRGLTILLRWTDVDRVRLDISWIDCSATALSGGDPCEVEEAISVFDSLAQDWGVAPSDTGWAQWMIAATE